MNKPINWFEIPVQDMSRAVSFYNKILGLSLKAEPFAGQMLAVFPYERGAATGGALIATEDFTPSLNGTVPYLSAGDDLDPVLEAVFDAGGKILVPRTQLPPGMGSFAQIADSEGNRIGLHATV